MGRPIKDLTGKTFNSIKVNSFFKRENNKTFYKCVCLNCGKEFIADNSMIHKNIGCGCLRGKNTFRWGHHDNPHLYKKWNHMKSRCENQKDISYKNYGARGIHLCKEWQDYDVFYEWAIINGYKKGLEIDRIDPNDGYNPNNCRFVTRKQNNRNQRKTRYYVFNNEKLSLGEIAERLGVSYKVLWQQLTRDKTNKYNLIDIKET